MTPEEIRERERNDRILGMPVTGVPGDSPTVSEPRTDSLIAAWRKWSDRFATGQGGETPIRDAFAAGWDARAEAAQPIDVERAEQAFKNIGLWGDYPEWTGTRRQYAEKFAAEYARLRASDTDQ